VFSSSRVDFGHRQSVRLIEHRGSIDGALAQMASLPVGVFLGWRAEYHTAGTHMSRAGLGAQ
jgi:hypothetical protein